MERDDKIVIGIQLLLMFLSIDSDTQQQRSTKILVRKICIESTRPTHGLLYWWKISISIRFASEIGDGNGGRKPGCEWKHVLAGLGYSYANSCPPPIPARPATMNLC